MSKEFNTNKVAIIAQGKLHELYELGLAGVDAIPLYTFYYYTSNWQQTRQAKATGKYCWTKLGWSNRRFYAAKKILAEKGLIIEVQKSQKGVFSEVYIKLPYKATEATTADVVQHLRTADVLDRTAVQNTTNTLSVDNIYALNVNNLEEEDVNKIFSNESTCRDDATTVDKGNTRPAPATVTTRSANVKDVIKAIQKYAQTTWHTPRIEALSNKTEAKITKLLDKYTFEQFQTAIDNALGYTVDIKLIANIVKTEDKFINCLNFIKPEEHITNRTKF